MEKRDRAWLTRLASDALADGKLITHDMPHLDCQWFALCREPVVFERAHPVLKWVPVCLDHATWGER